MHQCNPSVELLTDSIWYKDVHSHKTPMKNMLKMKPSMNCEKIAKTLQTM